MGLFSFKPKAAHLPGRIAAGVFILTSGIGKLSADEETAKGVHGFAAGTYPFLSKVDPKTFVRALAISEIALGTALVIPVVPAALAGAGLTAFSGGLLGLYFGTPGMHKDGSLAPPPVTEARAGSPGCAPAGSRRWPTTARALRFQSESGTGVLPSSFVHVVPSADANEGGLWGSTSCSRSRSRSPL